MKTIKTYKIAGMHCTSCAMLIEGELEDRGLEGACNFAKGVLEVQDDSEVIDDAKVKEAVEAAGYKVSQ